MHKCLAWTSVKSRFVIEVDAELALQMSDFSVTPPTPAGNGNSEKIASVEKSGRFVSANIQAYLPSASKLSYLLKLRQSRGWQSSALDMRCIAHSQPASLPQCPKSIIVTPAVKYA